jgi:hypothetical protein
VLTLNSFIADSEFFFACLGYTLGRMARDRGFDLTVKAELAVEDLALAGATAQLSLGTSLEVGSHEQVASGDDIEQFAVEAALTISPHELESSGELLLSSNFQNLRSITKFAQRGTLFLRILVLWCPTVCNFPNITSLLRYALSK